MASTQMFVPCLYTALTTIVAFLSLIVSDIKPITDFGLLMATSIVIAFLVTFPFFPQLFLSYPKRERLCRRSVLWNNIIYIPNL